jgi:hypothetical protein
MKRRQTAVEARIVELRDEIAKFDAMADSGGERDMAACVGARKNASQLRRELASIMAEREAAATKDPVRRLEKIHARAVQDGSWVAAAQLANQVEAARAKQQAARDQKAEEAKRDPAQVLKSAIASFKRAPDAMQEELLGGLLGAAGPGVRARAMAPYVLGDRVEARRKA